MKSYKYFLFDWDGSLARMLDMWLEALKASLQHRGYTFSDAEIGANFAVFRARMGEKIDNIDAIIDEARETSAHKTPSVVLYPGALETLEYLLARGKKIALVTTSFHAQVDPLLEKYAMLHLFDAVVCGDDVVHGKPDAEPIEKALKLLHGNKQDTIMVGDSGTDIAAAANAGVDSALFYPPAHATFYDIQQLKQLHPTYIIEDFKELTSLS